MEPFPSIQRIHNLVRQEEKQQEINIRTTPTIDSATFQRLNHLLGHRESVNVLFVNIVTSMVILLPHATRFMDFQIRRCF
ncbi:hypothetical protein Pint_35456 [Pistacia integerrima]|uniref:Uncharacterized protein n=1 Tax=Pistacia integerrima TaxID=434235 RepID=A0ACC0Y0M4_9ROSI|nr:hypothetical protein Pint_35456 [Pistacia integerrima]